MVLHQKYDKFKKNNRGPLPKLLHWTKKIIHTSQSRPSIRKLPVQDHMTHVDKVDFLIGQKENDNLHFNLKNYFSSHIYRKIMHFINICTVIYESKA